MPTSTRSTRRKDTLSLERIVAAAVQILDREGEDALTFRALAAKLATGSGALYWHVADKQALLAAATDTVMAGAMTPAGRKAKPADAIRALALGVFDAIDAHPWVGAQLSRDPWQASVLRLLEGIGQRVQALGARDAALFHGTTALMSFILGLAGQYAATARLFPRARDKAAFLDDTAAQWAQLDAAAYPFVRGIAAALPAHDERAQFQAGIDLILAGITAPRR